MSHSHRCKGTPETEILHKQGHSRNKGTPERRALQKERKSRKQVHMKLTWKNGMREGLFVWTYLSETKSLLCVVAQDERGKQQCCVHCLLTKLHTQRTKTQTSFKVTSNANISHKAIQKTNKQNNNRTNAKFLNLHYDFNLDDTD